MKVAVSISTYTNSKFVMDMTKNCIRNIRKNTNFSVICTNHLHGDAELIDMCDLYIYDKKNVLIKNNTVPYGTYSTEYWHLTYSINDVINNNYHGPAVHQNIYNGVSLANNINADYVICMNYDIIPDKDEFDRITTIIENLYHEDLNGFFIDTDRTGYGIKFFDTSFFIIKPSFFLERFSQISDESDYSNLILKSGAPSIGLENIYYHTFEKDIATFQVGEDIGSYFKSLNNTSNTQVKTYLILPVYRQDNFSQSASVVILSGHSIESYDVLFEVHRKNELIFSGNHTTFSNSWFISNEIQLEDDHEYTVTFTVNKHGTVEKHVIKFSSYQELMKFGNLHYYL